MTNQSVDTEMLDTAATQDSDPEKFLTISNLLSLTRVILAAPFALVMLSDVPNASLWGIAILALAALTDKFDGVFARKYHQVTEWGKILDPVSDKIGMGVVALVLVMLGLIPLWFVVFVIVRDVLILVGGIYLKQVKGVVLQSNQLGKWTIGVLALTMLFAMLRFAFAAEVFVWLSVAMLVGSLAMYLQRFVSEMKSLQSPVLNK
ncbi:MAG: CDP-alcohol phosphatidyltransferase family protein [Ignavibacteriae bacterium]|nr:CDP-alcohol phosphatidyltransferase family protein [Ignavibacteriota bacterium]